MDTIEINFTEAEARILLAALTEKEEKLMDECQRTVQEDGSPSVGMELEETRAVLNVVKEKAVRVFGIAILNFSGSII